MTSSTDDALLCPICADILNNACETACGHAFCEICINTWLETNVNRVCPVCRKQAIPVHPSFALRAVVHTAHPERGKVSLKPTTAQDEKELGNACFKRLEFAKAIQHYSQSIEITRDETVFSNRALCYMKTEQWNLAIQDCNEALTLNPKYIKALLRKAICCENLGQTEKAKESILKAIEADKEKRDFIEEITTISQRLGMFTQPPTSTTSTPTPTPNQTEFQPQQNNNQQNQQQRNQPSDFHHPQQRQQQQEQESERRRRRSQNQPREDVFDRISQAFKTAFH